VGRRGGSLSLSLTDLSFEASALRRSNPHTCIPVPSTTAPGSTRPSSARRGMSGLEAGAEVRPWRPSLRSALLAGIHQRLEPRSVSATIVARNLFCVARASVRSRPVGALHDGVRRGEVVQADCACLMRTQHRDGNGLTSPHVLGSAVATPERSPTQLSWPTVRQSGIPCRQPTCDA
jgi:hypothetical protein